jgi:DNA modification methylase
MTSTDSSEASVRKRNGIVGFLTKQPSDESGLSSSHVSFFIQKNKDVYYYLVENYRQDGKYKRRYLASFGRERPVFYQPNLIKGYCEDHLKTMASESVDLIIDDPPYGTTELPWDKAPNWESLAGLYHHVLKDNGLIYIFGKQPSLIDVYNIFSELFDFRFEVIWNRNNVPWSSNFKPLPVHENIFVFCKKGAAVERTKFYLKNVMTAGKPYKKHRSKKSPTQRKYVNNKPVVNVGEKRYPKSILNIPPPIGSTPEYTGHPTQKPLELMRWIILASTQRDDIVLDPHVGSGTTLLAALWLCRRSVGVELYQGAYDIASKRISDIIDRLPAKYMLDSIT